MSEKNADKLTVASSSNAMYLWHGFSQVDPRSFSVFGSVPIHQVAIGSRHCGFLTAQGQLYMYGNNQFGQLGIGTFENSLEEPLLVESLAGEVVCYVACGAHHTAAITVNGQVYCWGDSTEGQCGVDGIAITPLPQAVPIIDKHPSCKHSIQEDKSVKMLQVACGNIHTVALSEYGEVWVWGSGVQLGLGTTAMARTPQRLDFLTGRRILRVACGAEHTLVLVQKLSRKSKMRRQGSSVDSTGKPSSVAGCDSPVQNDVQQHRYRPSTCIKCKEEIYTYTETSDACIIESTHKCPLGLDVHGEKKLTSSMSCSRLSSVDGGVDSSVTDGKTSVLVEDTPGVREGRVGDDGGHRDEATCSQGPLEAADVMTSSNEGSSGGTASKTDVDKVPAIASDVPTSTSDVPTSTSDVPTSMSDVPTSTSDVPTSTSDVSLPTSDVPTSMSDVPISVRDVPMSASDVSTSASDVPTSASCVLASVSGLPTSVSEVSTSAIHALTSSGGVPTSASCVLTSSSDVPTSVNHVPLSSSASSTPVPDQNDLYDMVTSDKRSNYSHGNKPAPLSLVDPEKGEWHSPLSTNNSHGDIDQSLSLKGPESLPSEEPVRNSCAKTSCLQRQDELNDSLIGAALSMQLIHPDPSSHTDHSAVTETSLSDTSLPSLTKSRSAFLNENQAKEFLQKQLAGCEEEEASKAKSPPSRQWSTSSQKSTSSSPPTSPFVKKMENILQHVPMPPAAMQEYVTNLTKSVVTNIRTSIDKFGFVSGVMEDEEGVSTDSNSQSEGVRLKDGMQVGDSLANDDLERVATFERYGTLPKSTSLGPSAYKMTGKGHLRKASLPSGMLETLRDERLQGWLGEEITLETEVWSWGRGDHGQLGHGDRLNRIQPCVVNHLSDQRVVKLVCGTYHSLALTASCSLYCWGSNSHNQICSIDTITPSPTKTLVQGGAMVWDIAAGDQHSLLLCDCTGFTPDVFYSGKSPGVEKGSPFYTTNQFTRIGVLRKKGWMSQVVAGGDLCGCILESHDRGLTAVLHEFAVTERFFFSQLDLVATTFLKPLLNDEGFRPLEGTTLGASMQLLVDSFCHLADSIPINHLQLTRVITGKLTWDKVNIVSLSDKSLAAFQVYSKCFGDVLAVDGFDHCSKVAKNSFDKVQGKFVLVVEEKRVDRATVGATFRRTLQIPFKRLKEYSKLLGKMALKYPAYSTEHTRLTQISQSWDALRQTTTADHSLADNTRNFWHGPGVKYSEGLKTTGRRMLRDSKRYPIHLQAAKRFSSHIFLLFTDVFVHVQYSTPQVYPLVTIWVETTPDSDALKHAIVLVTPEDRLTLAASSASEKGEWLWAINQAINSALSEKKKNLARSSTMSPGRGNPPPRDRHANHLFMKAGSYKDAQYQGMWRQGKMHGHGELVWPDGRLYVGMLKEGQLDGVGVMTTPSAEGQERYEGHWKNGKHHGLGSFMYSNGDHYKGYFTEGKRCGHGVFKQGKLMSDCTLASIYVGEWSNDKRHGYGVYEDLHKGEKYMGLWLDDSRHGNGIIVTLDGVYFEGHFAYHKITGTGLLMTEDNTFYEGQFSGGTTLYGKGTLTLPQGDYIEGNFHGSFADGVKVTGTFHKCSKPLTEHRGFTHAIGLLPRSFGQFSVEAHRKWGDIFQHCYTMLDCLEASVSPVERSRRAWERVASVLAASKSHSGKDAADGSPWRSASRLESSYDELEMIPVHNTGLLTVQSYQRIQQYLAKALDTPSHPLGKLVEGLVDVYRATYVGVGAHPRLLYHAVQEARSFVARIYPIVRILFPDLPEDDDAQLIFSEAYQNGQDEDDSQCEMVSPAGLIHTLLLPKIYPPLFTLYALYNEREDEKYWRRVRYWNKQPDIALLAYLSVDQRFWLLDESAFQATRSRITAIRNRSYTEAIDTLQRMSTSFSPAEKLDLIQNTFDEVNKVVQSRLQSDYLWSMDDLFPVFLYVVIRARIQHLGAEIHFIDDLMQKHLEFGELGIMFTTLKACYFQIQQEKLV